VLSARCGLDNVVIAQLLDGRRLGAVEDVAKPELAQPVRSERVELACTQRTARTRRFPWMRRTHSRGRVSGLRASITRTADE
jgi:hypothetical protein